jgi:hypothetical protein
MKKIFVLLIFYFQIQFINAQTLPALLYVNSAPNSEGRTLFTDQYGNTYAAGVFIGADFDPSPMVNYLPPANGVSDIFVVKYNKIGQYIWAISIGGSGSETCFGLTGDSLGNIYVTGLFSGTGDFDPGIGTAMLSSNGDDDIFIAKYNTNGQYQWAFNIGGANDDRGYAIKTDSLNNVYVTGYFEGAVDFDPSPASTILNSGPNTDYTFLAKYNSGGQFQWGFSLNAHNFNTRNLSCDRAGNCYLVARYGGTIDVDPSPAVAQLTNSGVSMAIIKYNSSGQYLWAKDYNVTSGNGLNINSLSLDAQSNIYVTGLLQGTVDMNFSSSINSVNGIGLNDIFLGKYDKDGNYLVSFNLGWPSTAHWGFDVIADKFSNFYIVGIIQGLLDFDPSPATATIVPPGGQDGFIAKYNSSGQYQWAFAIGGGPLSDVNYAITTDGDGSLMTTGYFQNNVDFDPGPAIVNIPNVGADFYIAKYGACVAPSTPSNVQATNLFCSGNPATLSVTNSGNIYWYNSPISTTSVGFGSNFSPALTTGGSPTTYTFYAEAKTCTISPQRAVVIVTVIPSPTVSAGVSPNQVCAGTSVTLSGSGTGDTFNWLSVGAGLTQTVAPAITTSFVFVSTNTLTGCSSSVAVTPTINPLPLIIVNSGAICAGKSFTINPSGAITYTYSSGTNIVSPNNTTSYSVTGTSSAGCISATQAIVNVIVNPTPTILASNGTICSGQTFTINPSGANTYTYSSGTNVVSPNNTTSYSVIGTSTAGCVSTTMAIVTVSVNPSPTLTVGNGSLCAGQSFTINPSGANTYTYSSGTNVVSPITTTAYSVTGTSSAGCISASPAVISISVSPSPTISVSNGTICSGISFTINPSGANTYTYSSGTNIISPITTTSYSVSGTSTAGCISTTPAIVSVSVNQTPTITVNSGAICTGDSFTINPSGASTYTYSSGTNIVSPTTNSSYSVSGASTAGCISATPAISNLTVNSLPTVNVATNASIICTGQSATITANGANTYSWNTTSTNTTIVVSPTINTTYTVMGTDANNCQNFSVITQSVSLCTGIGMQDLTGSIIIYPNPSEGIFSIQCNSISEDINIKVYNTLGQLILEQKSKQENTVIDLSAYAAGLYYLKVRTQNSEETIKLIKE